MKLGSRDIMEILRTFKVATQDDSPQNIERLEHSNPTPVSVLYSFNFHRTNYRVLVDNTVEDDEDILLSEAQIDGDASLLEKFSNPLDETTYALPFHGKDIYLLRAKDLTRRLDARLAETNTEHSRSTWQKLVKAGRVSVNGTIEMSPKRTVHPADTITTEGAPEHDFSDQTLPIIYQDNNVVVVNKPSGVLTHSKGALNDEFTVADFFERFTKNGLDTNRPGIIHRLDRDTSGVIIGARNDSTALLLKKQFSERTTKKTYIAVTTKVPKQPKGLIDVPIGRNPSAPSTFRADANGKSAQTYYETLAVSENGAALLKLQPRTGRTHQLRVHLLHIGTPVVGDRVYGKLAERLMLHAYQLEITIPNGDRQTFTAPVPREFLADFPDIEL